MKLAPVLVPPGFLVLPTVFMVFHIVVGVALGKEVGQVTYPTRPLNRSKLRLLIYPLATLYMFGLIASVAWAIYVFTGKLLPSDINRRRYLAGNDI